MFFAALLQNFIIVIMCRHRVLRGGQKPPEGMRWAPLRAYCDEAASRNPKSGDSNGRKSGFAQGSCPFGASCSLRHECYARWPVSWFLVETPRVLTDIIMLSPLPRVTGALRWIDQIVITVDYKSVSIAKRALFFYKKTALLGGFLIILFLFLVLVAFSS